MPHAIKIFPTTLKFAGKTADRCVMDLTTLVDTAAPTPFGWVITTQTAFDLNTVLAFRSQLASMSKFFENQKAAAPTVIGKRAPEHDDEEEETLEPVPLKVA